MVHMIVKAGGRKVRGAKRHCAHCDFVERRPEAARLDGVVSLTHCAHCDFVERSDKKAHTVQKAARPDGRRPRCTNSRPEREERSRQTRESSGSEMERSERGTALAEGHSPLSLPMVHGDVD